MMGHRHRDAQEDAEGCPGSRPSVRAWPKLASPLPGAEVLQPEACTSAAMAVVMDYNGLIQGPSSHRLVTAVDARQHGDVVMLRTCWWKCIAALQLVSKDLGIAGDKQTQHGVSRGPTYMDVCSNASTQQLTHESSVPRTCTAYARLDGSRLSISHGAETDRMSLIGGLRGFCRLRWRGNAENVGAEGAGWTMKEAER
jgi:hypothetical protein